LLHGGLLPGFLRHVPPAYDCECPANGGGRLDLGGPHDTPQGPQHLMNFVGGGLTETGPGVDRGKMAVLDQ